MGRTPRVPEALTRGPFTLADARKHGLNAWNLHGADWRRIAPGTYVSAAISDTPLVKVQGAGHRLPPAAAFSGFTAAWLHGLDVPCDPIEITVPVGVCVSSRAGMVVHRRLLDPRDVVKLRGFRATSLTRTVRDLCARLSLTEAVVIADMALHARRIDVSDLCEEAARSGGQPGAPMLRRALQYVEPAAESPMETRLRMLLVLAGLPRPESQIAIRDRLRRFLGRPDLYYRDQRLGLEYDGGLHRDSLAEDNRRQNRLVDAGVRLLRFTAGDIYNTPDAVISLVRTALGA